MDETNEIQSQINPWEKANFLSKITFAFAFNTFRKGAKRDLNEKDIYKVTKKCAATTLGDSLEKEWEKEKLKPSPHIMRCLMRMFGKEFVILTTLYLIINTGLLTIMPLLKGKVISFFSLHQSELSKVDACIYGIILMACTCVNFIFAHSYEFRLEQLTLRAKIAVCVLIYRKSLKLNTDTISKIATGQAITLITKDVSSFDLTLSLMNQLWIGITQIVIMTFVTYKQIGISALMATLILLSSVPLQIGLGKLIATFRLKTAKRTDQRIKVIQEILMAIRIIKMYVWETYVTKLVTDKRSKEIRFLRIIYYVRGTMVSIGQTIIRAGFFFCIIIYVLLGNHITAEKAFVITSCFAALRVTIVAYIPFSTAYISQAIVAFRRIQAFLELDEITQQTVDQQESNRDINLKNIFLESNNTVIFDNISLNIQPGLTIVTGQVGCGKTTFLKMLLGDVKQTTGNVRVPSNMSYASQEPWLFPGSVRKNIIFNKPYNEYRYNEVVSACCLKKDLEELQNGDNTKIIDKGLNLSRGQKARINLARAVYNNADVYLLDDCLSTVDGYVGRQIYQNCIKGILKDKICVLVTHQERYFEKADCIIVLQDSRILFKGSFEKFKNCDENNVTKLVKVMVSRVNQNNQIEESEIDVNKSNELLKEDNKLNVIKNIYEENKEEGTVKKEIYGKYFRNTGGIFPIILILLIAIITQVTYSWFDYFVSNWVNLEEELSTYRSKNQTHLEEYKNLEKQNIYIMKLYFGILVATFIFTYLRAASVYHYASKSATAMHNMIFYKIINSGMIFFDTHLSGNIINRFSRDIGITDEQLPHVVYEFLVISTLFVGTLYVIISVNLYFIIPVVLYLTALSMSRHFFLKISRSIKRLEGTTRSPVIGHMNATLEGLLTIRSHKSQETLKRELEKHQDLYSSTLHMNIFLTEAFGFCLDTICLIFIGTILFSFLIFKTDVLVGGIGLAITQSFALMLTVAWGVRQWANFENNMTSVERVLEYSKIEEEEKLGNMLADWPSSGKINFDNVSLRYSIVENWVLKDISFAIKSGEKIGVVGRTGAGKTSIISSLFRLYNFQGTIHIDDVNICDLNTDLLRSKISVIPQDPVLFSGTIRSNLDPMDEYDDEVLWEALQDIKMKHTIGSLEDEVIEGGSNFSVGQKQLISLARAILKNNTIVALDEATSNTDSETDTLIHDIIRKKFSGCTVIIVAHRISTILNSDRVLVVDSGKIVEFDVPERLLSNRNSLFSKIAKEAGL